MKSGPVNALRERPFFPHVFFARRVSRFRIIILGSLSREDVFSSTTTVFSLSFFPVRVIGHRIIPGADTIADARSLPQHYWRSMSTNYLLNRIYYAADPTHCDFPEKGKLHRQT